MKRILLSTLLILTMISSAFADGISFVASAPKSVVVGNRFNISYELNTKADSEPTISEVDGLRVLSGPHPSTFTSRSNVNGRVTTKQTITYTYIVAIDKEGEITIPAASIMVKGKMHTSNPLTIKVLPKDQPLPASQKNTNPKDIADNRIFIRTEVNKTNVYEQEAVELTYKVYYVDPDMIRGISEPTPELIGFKMEKIEMPDNLKYNLEHYNGHNYFTYIVGKYILFPQKTGKLEIPAVKCEAIVLVENEIIMDPLVMALNGFSPYNAVKKELKSKKIAIEVKKLPTNNKPKDFSGAVGDFTISTTMNTNKLKSNEQVNLKVTIKGYGNMKLMGDPVVDFPSEFDVENIDQDMSKIQISSKGFSGEKEFQYILTPRTAGTFTIPAIKFVYFDSKTGEYKTVESKEQQINVEKGTAPVTSSGSGYMSMKVDGKIIATDIRHIKLGDSQSDESIDTFYASTSYCLLYVISLAAFAVAVFVYRKRIKENSNLALVKTKKANSVAVRRLKNAKLLLRDERKNEFYDEILKAIWGYMSDKLNIPLSQLSKENISSELYSKGCDDVLVDKLMSLLNEGEFARYAPGDEGATMENVYKMALDVIGKMENTIKK